SNKPFFYQDPFPLKKDDTEYYLLTSEHVSVAEFEGQEILKVAQQSKNIPCQLCTPQQENGGKVLVISCITGMGTAEKIKKVLEES
ncbi:hypothetical protein MJI46_31790, partial [Salmonella enterica subsp. enterica serovar Cerro]|nr:hypothetical protein [Salmonella enterica subsp. enterica serovar Cerro]